MSLLKRIVKIFLIISLFILFIPITKEISVKKKVKEVIDNSPSSSIYSGFIYIPKFDYKNLIKEGEDSLDDNLVELTNFSEKIGDNKIILAGHNNKYVFNKIYNLDIDDQIVISDFIVDYNYKVIGRKIIKVDDFSYFDEDGLYLITCTNNNQQRFIIKAKREL
jgi:LPXTG-site transpeptidase (sortase) family protein